MEDKLGDKTGDKLEQADKASQTSWETRWETNPKRRRQHRRWGGKQDGRQAGRRTQIADKADTWGKHWKSKQPTVCGKFGGWLGGKSQFQNHLRKRLFVKRQFCLAAALICWCMTLHAPTQLCFSGWWVSLFVTCIRPGQANKYWVTFCRAVYRCLCEYQNFSSSREQGHEQRPWDTFMRIRWICFGLKVDPMFFCKHINLVWKTVVLSLRVISGTLGKHGLWTHWPCCFSNAQMVIVEHPWKTTKPARVRHRHRQTRSKVVVSKCFWFSNWDIHQDTTFAKGLQCQQSKKYRVFGIALFGFRTERFQPDAHKCQGQWTGFALCHLGNSLDVPRISWISHHDRWKSTTQLMHLGKHYCRTCHVG